LIDQDTRARALITDGDDFDGGGVAPEQATGRSKPHPDFYALVSEDDARELVARGDVPSVIDEDPCGVGNAPQVRGRFLEFRDTHD